MKQVFRTLQSFGPRSLDVFYFEVPIGHQPHRDGVEAIGTRPEVATRNPPASGYGNRLTLSSCNGLQGMSERRPATPLYLHKRDEPILFHYEIDLLAKEANVTVKNSPTSLIQEGFGQRFEAASATYGAQTMKACLRSWGDMTMAG